MTEEKVVYDVTAARLALESDREDRVQQCGEAIKAALSLYQCRISAAPQFSEDGRIGAVIKIEAE